MVRSLKLKKQFLSKIFFVQIKVSLTEKFCLYLIASPFQKNSQNSVPYRRPLPVPYGHLLPVVFTQVPMFL